MFQELCQVMVIMLNKQYGSTMVWLFVYYKPLISLTIKQELIDKYEKKSYYSLLEFF